MWPYLKLKKKKKPRVKIYLKQERKHQQPSVDDTHRTVVKLKPLLLELQVPRKIKCLLLT